MRKFAVGWHYHRNVAAGGCLACQSLTMSQSAYLQVFTFGACEGLQVFHAGDYDHPARRAATFSAACLHPVELMILKVPQQRLGMVSDFQRPFKQVFNHNAGHLALIGYGH
jgi:hypothetical protein